MKEINLEKEHKLIETKILKLYFEMFALPIVLIGGLILVFIAFNNLKSDDEHRESKKKMVHIRNDIH